MTYHILNGHCLANQIIETNIQGQLIVCAECLIDGNLSGVSLADFFKNRANFIAKTYNTTVEDYHNKCVNEFEKINNIPENSEVCLWFENDLFCQSNMWFILSLLINKKSVKIFRIFPIIENDKDTWKGFGISNTKMLEQAYNSKIQLTNKDMQQGENLWKAYKTSDFITLKELSQLQSQCFQYLEEVCKAHTDRFTHDNSLGLPEKTVKDILENISTDFKLVFSEFSKRLGIYGFGDIQVKNIYDKLIKKGK